MEVWHGSSGRPPAATFVNSSTIDVFVAAANGSLQHKHWDGTWIPSFYSWDILEADSQLASALSGFLCVSDTIGVVFRGEYKNLKYMTYDGFSLGQGIDLGGNFSGGPAAVNRYLAAIGYFTDVSILGRCNPLAILSQSLSSGGSRLTALDTF